MSRFFFGHTWHSFYLDFQVKCSGMKLLNDMKTKIKADVQFSYEFGTSLAPESISRNASRAQALLVGRTSIYQVYFFVLYRHL